MEFTLIFPHQLFRSHPAVRRDREILLIEDPLFFGNDGRWPLRLHRQKITLHRASMTAYARRLEAEGYRVRHCRCPSAGGMTGEVLEREIPKPAKTIHVADLVDDVLERRLARFAEHRNAILRVVSTPQFLSPAKFLSEQFPEKQKPFMARFYQAQRLRMRLLIEEDGSPTGGRWSFDTENRRKLPRGAQVPEPCELGSSKEKETARKEIDREFPDALGDAGCAYPVTPAEAVAWLADFLRWRFHAFGDYEDAISARHRVLFHSVLTPCLNIGLLEPAAVVESACEYAREKKVPLNSLEGFVRQIVGWREFMRAMYEHSGPAMRTSNFWGFRRKMPKAFYDGTTGIAPVDHVIRNVLKTSYCHHIERLMVLGNFMLLCRIHPDEVYRWFMEMFIDAYDWVMVPNVYGMSQFADGGNFTTKPYLSGSNYVRKMSDFPEGDWCGIWDALFWTFIADYREVFAANPRLSMMARTCDRMGTTKLTEHRRVAEAYLGMLF